MFFAEHTALCRSWRCANQRGAGCGWEFHRSHPNRDCAAEL